MQLIVLIHGMWGKAGDFNYMVNELVSHHGFTTYDEFVSSPPVNAPSGVVYCTRSNEGYFTYDGIDVCGLRIANEITKVVRSLREHDSKITEISIVGYSMGGLMARYAIGLLYTRRMFDDIKPAVFITACSPHVGVNVLGESKGARLFNQIGSWSMARTSRQAFLRDDDQPYRMPLFLYLTKANTACTLALSLFRKRVLYANAAHDHRCEFYTSAVEQKDPFKNQDIRSLTGPFVVGYEPVVLSGKQLRPVFQSPFNSIAPASSSSSDSAQLAGTPTGKLAPRGAFLRSLDWLKHKLVRFFKLGFLVVKVGMVLPVWFLGFLLNANYQRLASSLRIRSTLKRQDLTIDDGNEADIFERSAEGMVENVYRTVQGEGGDPSELKITPMMRRIIEQFNDLGWEKYILRIVATERAHSAAINKMPRRKDFHEGKISVKHIIQSLVE